MSNIIKHSKIFTTGGFKADKDFEIESNEILLNQILKMPAKLAKGFDDEAIICEDKKCTWNQEILKTYDNMFLRILRNYVQKRK
jgi:hypothetical protein